MHYANRHAIIKNSTQIMSNLWEQAVITADTPAVPLGAAIADFMAEHTGCRN